MDVPDASADDVTRLDADALLAGSDLAVRQSRVNLAASRVIVARRRRESLRDLGNTRTRTAPGDD